MSSVTVPDSLEIKGNHIAIGLNVIFVKEGDYMVAYSPSLDLSAYGKDLEEADNAFREVLDIYLEDVWHKRTIHELLLNHGWTSTSF